MATELRPLQIRVLKALAKSSGPLSRPKLYEALGFKAQSGLNDIVGKDDPAKRAQADKDKYPSLITLGFIKSVSDFQVDETHTERVYQITASGRKALEKTEAPAKPKKAPKSKKEAVAPAA